MTGDESLQFVAHLRQINRLTPASDAPAERGGTERSAGKLWELTDLTAN